MVKTVNEKLFDFQVAQSIRWIRLGNREAREAITILNSVNDQLKTVIRDNGVGETTFSQRRRVALKNQIDNLLDVMHDQLEKQVTDLSQETAILSAEIEAESIQKALPIEMDIVTPNIGVLQLSLIHI